MGFDLDGDGNYLDELFQGCIAGTSVAATTALSAAGMPYLAGPAMGAAAPYLKDYGNTAGDELNGFIGRQGEGAETGAWAGGIGGMLLGGPMGLMTGSMLGAHAGDSVSDYLNFKPEAKEGPPISVPLLGQSYQPYDGMY
jgi:hypothetical protein